ncbi:hypothetical protein AMATHDRAFT_7991 [Amanita thiersii Skay4041]|uniref:REJ domain-containing protein n=1 Tax=Amanita thiersii Skay4041 TaxID=703135 RepID=A0A2A9NEW9_9AGAR|nr:hypothetical protein AMATHDRAFT_7991 [Amanita thiersii Skay4041]
MAQFKLAILIYSLILVLGVQAQGTLSTTTTAGAPPATSVGSTSVTTPIGSISSSLTQATVSSPVGGASSSATRASSATSARSSGASTSTTKGVQPTRTHSAALSSGIDIATHGGVLAGLLAVCAAVL